MKTKHTPEPWRVGWGEGIGGPTCPSIQGPTCAEKWPFEVIRKDGECLAILPAQDNQRTKQPNAEEAKANAERIVACVNALAGLNPEAVADALDVLRIIAGKRQMAPVNLHESQVFRYSAWAIELAEAALANLKGETK